MRLLIADFLTKKPIGVLYDVLVKLDKFILLEDFIVLDCEIGQEIPIFLGRPFLATRREIINMDLSVKLWTSLLGI